MSLILFLFFTLLTPKQCYAVDEFNVKQIINYSVNPQGQTTVKQEINLTNKISQIYAKEYQINLSGSKLENIQANDKSGNILDQVKTQDDTTTINLKFQNPIVGKDKTNQFFLNYTIADFAQKKGNTWELHFPLLTNSSNDQTIDINVEVPTSFGELSFSSIPIKTTHTVNNLTQITFNQQLLKNKILLVFGNHQLFDFKLNYYLKNDQPNILHTEIPIPPDTNRQTINLKKIDPPPSEIKVDNDGNWLAQYVLKPDQSINITVEGQAKIHPFYPVQTPPNDSTYLETQKFWPTTDPQIINLSSTLNSPKKIYDFVVNTLNYDYENINYATRKGAKSALEFPNLSLCTEFTDLFVTLARANKISAREIEGYAYSNNNKIKPTNTSSDVLHAWPEYFDTTLNRWIQIDPTWEKTTNGIDYFSDLDLNHITFVIHGQKSDYPPPPGSYKKDKTVKSVFVDFATQEIKSEPNLPKLTLISGQLTIKNTSLFSLNSVIIKLPSQNWQHQINLIPPLSSVTLTVPQYSVLQSLLPQSTKYNFQINSSQYQSPISISLDNQQHYLYLSVVIGFTILLLITGGIILSVSHKSK